MGQYYYPVNLDKREYIHPHKFGDGLKLLEFGCSTDGTMTALAILLADGNNRGGGDLRSDNPIIGSWAGDRIVIAGDYADPGKFMPKTTTEELQRVANKCFSEGYQKPEEVNLHCLAGETFKDISAEVMAAMVDDDYIKSTIESQYGGGFRLDETIERVKSLRPDLVITAKAKKSIG